MDALDLIDAHAGEIAAADAILVFGTQHWVPAELAAGLYFEGLAPVIVTTGGSQRHPRGLSEGLVHQRLLLAAGVPDTDIISEQASTNTVENITKAKPLMVDRLGPARSLIAVVKWYHRRALVTPGGTPADSQSDLRS